MVSLTTVVAGSITQLYWIMANTLVSRVAQKKCCVDDECSSSSAVTLMARNGVSHMVSYLATIAKNPLFLQLGGLFALLLVGRLLQASGLMTRWTASQTIPFAFVLGIAMKCALPELPEDADIESHSSVVTFYSESASLAALTPHLIAAKENPYNSMFWSELETTENNTDPIDKVSLDPSDILSDLYRGLILM